MVAPESMLLLAVGYFVAYIPFAALTKALSSGLLPGIDEEVGGLVLLPAAAIGVLAGAVLFLWLNGWWRYVGLRPVHGQVRRFPSRTMLVAGLFMALIVGTTILNFTFAGVSILFMLLMMRAGTLVPGTGRRQPPSSAHPQLLLGRRWRLSLVAVAILLFGVDAYALTARRRAQPLHLPRRLPRPLRDHEPGGEDRRRRRSTAATSPRSRSRRR